MAKCIKNDAISALIFLKPKYSYDEVMTTSIKNDFEIWTTAIRNLSVSAEIILLIAFAATNHRKIFVGFLTAEFNIPDWQM